MIISKKITAVVLLCASMFVLQSFIPKEQEEKPQNLKILPKNISGEELHNVMKGFSKSLGVKCNYCHVSQEIAGQPHPKFDFASDDKIQKNIARKMMKMTEAINAKYLSKISAKSSVTLEEITCVTCHNGRATPIISTDSLAKK
jgi:hypothetical protein